MKSYTDIEQSKKLAEILPLESADMYYPYNGIETYPEVKNGLETKTAIPCWSLAALLEIIKETAYFMDEDASADLSSYRTIEWSLSITNYDMEPITADNPIDACYEMILKLHELKML